MDAVAHKFLKSHCEAHCGGSECCHHDGVQPYLTKWKGLEHRLCVQSIGTFKNTTNLCKISAQRSKFPGPYFYIDSWLNTTSVSELNLNLACKHFCFYRKLWLFNMKLQLASKATAEIFQFFWMDFISMQLRLCNLVYNCSYMWSFMQWNLF